MDLNSDESARRNHLTKWLAGITSQPGLRNSNGLTRDVMFNLNDSTFKLHRFTIGDFIPHVTVINSGDVSCNKLKGNLDHTLI